MWRRLILAMALLIGAMTGTIVALQSPRVGDNVRQRLEIFAHERWGIALHIGALELTLLPPTVHVHEVSLTVADGDVARLTLHEGAVRIRPWPSASGAIVFERLELDGLRGSLRVDAPDLSLPSSDGKGTQLPVEIEELALWSGDLVLDVGAWRLVTRRLDIEQKPNRIDGWDIDVTVGDGELHHQALSVPFELGARVTLEGTPAQPQRLLVRRAHLDVPRATLSANGLVDFAEGAGQDLRLRSHGALAALSAALGLPVKLAGEARADLMLRGSLPHPQLEVTLDADALTAVDTLIGDAHLEGVIVGRTLTVEALRLTHPRAGLVTGSGQIELDATLPLRLSTRLHSASLPHVLDLAGLADAHVRLWVDGDVLVQGHLRPLALDLDVDATAHNFAVLDGSYRNADAWVALALPTAQLKGGVHVGAHEAAINGVAVTRGSSRVLVSGRLSYDVDRGIDLRADAEHLRVSDIGPIAGLPMDGEGVASASVEGPYAALTISATAELADFGLFGYRLGDASAALVFTDMNLQIERITIRRGRGLAMGKLSLAFADGQSRLRSHFDLRDIALGDVLETLVAPEALVHGLRAELAGTFELAGSAASPRGTLLVSAPTLRVDEVSLGGLQVRGGFGGGPEAPMWIEGQLSPRAGALTARAETIGADRAMAINAEAEDFALASLAGLIPDGSVEGVLTGRLALAGTPAALGGEARVHAKDLRVGGLRLGDMTLNATAAGGRAEVDATLFQGQGAVKGTVDLKRGLPFAATATLSDAHAGALLAEIPDLDVTTSGTLFAQGAMLEPASVTADAQLQTLRIAWRELELEATTPVLAHYGQRRLGIDDLRLSGPQLSLSLSGDITTAGSLAMRAAVRGDLDALRQLWIERLDLASGSFDLQLALGGTLSVPLLEGAAQITGGSLRPRNSRTSIEDIVAHVAFLKRSISIEDGAARVGTGTLRFAGQAALPATDPPSVDLHVTLAQVPARPLSDTEIVTSGDLNLVGPLDDLLLRGTLQLDSLRYTANVDLERLIPKQERAPLRVPAFTPEEALRLEVHVTAPGNLLISNNVLEAELRADVLVSGTTDRMGLLGSVTPLWARARYRDNVFRVDRASIDFTDEYGIFAQFDVRARTRACNMDVTVEVNGDSRQYNVAPQGQDENGSVDPQDVLLCLQFGLRLRDFEGPNAASLQDTLPGGLDALWTVSGLDNKVRQLLPIKVDELRLTSGWSSSTKRTVPRVLVAKEFGRNLQLKYWRSLTETNDQELAIDYKLSEIAAVQASWDSASEVPTGDFGLDLRLRWEFR